MQKPAPVSNARPVDRQRGLLDLAAMSGDVPHNPLRLNSFWHGPELPPLARACLHSFVEIGHTVTLHVYDEPRGVPPGVALADASRILSRDQIFIQRTHRTVAPFTDRFRYELLARGAGAWIDCDLLCVKALVAAPYIFGWEDTVHVNNAVLMLPADSPILDDLRRIFTTRRWAPPWYKRSRQFRYKLKYLLMPSFGLASMFIGTTGPQALTYFARRHGVLREARPRHVFYPVAFADIADLLGDVDGVRRHLKPDTQCIHLWNTQLTGLAKDGTPARHSFLAHVLDGTWRDAIRS